MKGKTEFDELQKYELNKIIRTMQKEGIIDEDIGFLSYPIPIKIELISPYAESRLKERGITKEDAQSYIDNAMVMFEQRGNDRRLYVSNDGNAAVLVEGKLLITAYPSKDFDPGMKQIINEVKKYANK
jgi:hypothetical protein